jgi:hypothetical protein
LALAAPGRSRTGAAADILNQLTISVATAQQAEQDKRLALEQRLVVSEKTHFEKMTDAQKARPACAIALPLLICGCQSSLPRIQSVATQCRPATKPSAWFMEQRAPDLTRSMLNELSELPTRVTED